jgi:signal transduction histidine kinase
MMTGRRTTGWRTGLSLLMAAWLVFAVQDAALDAVAAGGLCLILAGAVRATALGRDPRSTMAIVAGATWLLPSALARLVDAPLVHALPVALVPVQLLALVVLMVDRPVHATVRVGLWLLGLLGILIAIAVLATWDPMLLVECGQRCGHAAPVVEVDSRVLTWIQTSLRITSLLSGLAIVLASMNPILSRPRRLGGVVIGLGGGLVGGVAIVTAADGIWRTVTSAPLAMFWWQPVLEWSDPLWALGAALIASGVALPAARSALAERRLRALAEAVASAPGPGGLTAALAGALGDPSARVLYPVTGIADLVDSEGRPAVPPGSGMRSTRLERSGRPIAVVVHRADLAPAALLSQLGPGSLVAIDNERLRAALLWELEELRKARQRIVELGDTERQRIERDLHDGAQQRLLAVAMELRIEADVAEREGDRAVAAHLAAAQVLAVTAIDQLRRIARGTYPAILSQAGLEPALRALADETGAPIELELSLARRMPMSVEAVAYAVVAELADELCQAGAGLDVRIEQQGASIHLEATSLDEPPPSLLERLADRIGAADGHMVAATTSGGGLILQADLPCA